MHLWPPSTVVGHVGNVGTNCGHRRCTRTVHQRGQWRLRHSSITCTADMVGRSVMPAVALLVWCAAGTLLRCQLRAPGQCCYLVSVKVRCSEASCVHHQCCYPVHVCVLAAPYLHRHRVASDVAMWQRHQAHCTYRGTALQGGRLAAEPSMQAAEHGQCLLRQHTTQLNTHTTLTQHHRCAAGHT